MGIARFLVSVSLLHNIPVVAMAAEKNHAKERPLDLSTDLSRLVGGNRSRELIAKFPEMRLVERRATTPNRLAVYSVWIEIDQGQASEFETLGVRHGVDVLVKQAEQEHAELTSKLDADLAAGGYDLSRVPAPERLRKAQEFLDRGEAVQKLRDTLRGLEIVKAAYPEATEPAPREQRASPSRLADEVVDVGNRDFWVKIVGMLQHNWALMDRRSDGRVQLYFIHDRSGVFDELCFDTEAAARAALARNGFERFEDSVGLQSFLRPPTAPFRRTSHTNGPNYSSGRFWNS